MADAATVTDAARSEEPLFRRGLRLIALALDNARRQFAAGIAGGLLYAGMTILSSYVLGQVTDRVILPAFEAGEVATGTLALAAAAIVGVAILKGAGVVGRRLGAYAAQFHLQSRFRRRITRQYLSLPVEWHRRHSTGQLLSNANADIESAFFIAAPLPMAIGATAMLIATAVMLLLTDPFLAAIGFAVGPAMAYTNRYFSRRMRAAATAAQRSRADVAEIAHESFDAAIVVKTLGREGAETERFRQESETLRDRMTEFGRLRASFDPLMEALPSAAILAVLFVGAWRVSTGALSAGDLVQFAYLFRLVALPMRVFGWLLGELPRAVVGIDRVQRVLDASGEMAYGSASGEGRGGAPVATREVGYRHPATVREDLAGPVTAGHTDADRGVEQVSFDVEAGSTLAVVGPTGSGKSTIASLLVRLLDPHHGSIEFDGRDLTSLERAQLARNVAIVFQEPFLFDDTVRNNITLGDDLPHEEVVAAARLAQADGFIDQLAEGYDTPVGERGSTLSGGQRQRIALARALIRRPRLLVLDDATSSVDPAVEAQILENLSQAELPSTVIVVAYRQGAIGLADEVLYVREGTVVARGPHEELLNSDPSYAHLVTAYARDGGPDDPASPEGPA